MGCSHQGYTSRLFDQGPEGQAVTNVVSLRRVQADNGVRAAKPKITQRRT